jgi:hypothetical protein
MERNVKMQGGKAQRIPPIATYRRFPVKAALKAGGMRYAFPP